MMKSIAVRNLRLCTKDCLCLYVCPVGATDTEDSVIDVKKCVGCGVCAAACPSGAISMVPEEYPPQQPKTEAVCAALRAMAESKATAEKAAWQLAAETESEGLSRLMTALARSERLVAEDLLREAGYMLPQSRAAHELLEGWVENPPAPSFPVEAAKRLLAMIPCNEPREDPGPTKWVCTVCGYVHEGPEPPEHCPVCRQPAEKFKKLEED